MQHSMRALPEGDLEAIFGIVVVLEGELLNGELPSDLTRRLVRRLTEHGPLPKGATAGELRALLADLGQRLHWAMGVDMPYPDQPHAG